MSTAPAPAPTRRPPCTSDPLLFESTDLIDHVEARRYCAVCPVIDWCREELASARRLAYVYGPGGTWAGQLVFPTKGHEHGKAVTSHAPLPEAV